MKAFPVTNVIVRPGLTQTSIVIARKEGWSKEYRKPNDVRRILNVLNADRSNWTVRADHMLNSTGDLIIHRLWYRPNNQAVLFRNLKYAMRLLNDIRPVGDLYSIDEFYQAELDAIDAFIFNGVIDPDYGKGA